MATYESDIVLGRKYRHKDLDVEGIAESVHFYKNACERVIIIYVDPDKRVQEASFDSVDLIEVETEKPVKNKEKKTGGPARMVPSRR